MTDDLRELDLQVALEITKLPHAGWYRRVSWDDTRRIRVSGPEDVADPHPSDIGGKPLEPNRSYVWHGHVDDEGIVQGATHTIPYYSTRWDEAMTVRDAVVTLGLGMDLTGHLRKRAGTWLMATPEDLCRVALETVQGGGLAEAERRPEDEEARLRAIAFREEDPTGWPEVIDGLRSALVGLDRHRQAYREMRAEADKTDRMLAKLDEAIMEETRGMGLAYDHRHMRVRHIGAERDKMAEALAWYAERHRGERAVEALRGYVTREEMKARLEDEGDDG